CRAPSGAKTELQETVKACTSEPPHDSSLALRSLTPDSTAYWRTGYELDGFAILFWSAADSVTILKVEPGGCAPSIESPLSASTEPSRGFRTAMPPRRSPSAATAARCRLGRIVARTDRPRRAWVAAIRRLPNSSTALGRPASRSL